MITRILLLLIGICLGFWLGRYFGLRDGQQQGESYAPIMLRAEALKTGSCPICGFREDKTD